jgi:hypothetical protein
MATNTPHLAAGPAASGLLVGGLSAARDAAPFARKA